MRDLFFPKNERKWRKKDGKIKEKGDKKNRVNNFIVVKEKVNKMDNIAIIIFPEERLMQQSVANLNL